MLQETREQHLPDEFIATFAGGYVRLDEAIGSAYREGSFHSSALPETFDSARRVIFERFLNIANAREVVNKEDFMTALALSNPRLANFIQRTEKVRVLMQQMEEQRQKITAMQGKIVLLESTTSHMEYNG
jgi:hypothetical protein